MATVVAAAAAVVTETAAVETDWAVAEAAEMDSAVAGSRPAHSRTTERPRGRHCPGQTARRARLAPWVARVARQGTAVQTVAPRAEAATVSAVAAMDSAVAGSRPAHSRTTERPRYGRLPGQTARRARLAPWVARVETWVAAVPMVAPWVEAEMALAVAAMDWAVAGSLPAHLRTTERSRDCHRQGPRPGVTRVARMTRVARVARMARVARVATRAEVAQMAVSSVAVVVWTVVAVTALAAAAMGGAGAVGAARGGNRCPRSRRGRRCRVDIRG